MGLATVVTVFLVCTRIMLIRCNSHRRYMMVSSAQGHFGGATAGVTAAMTTTPSVRDTIATAATTRAPTDGDGDAGGAYETAAAARLAHVAGTHSMGVTSPSPMRWPCNQGHRAAAPHTPTPCGAGGGGVAPAPTSLVVWRRR